MSFLSPLPGGNDEDDDFGSLSSSSNLPSLFQDSTSSMNSKKSLVYTAPKQPATQNPSSQPAMNVIIATAVNCYKLSNDKYEPLQGKIGLALLGNDESKIYQLLLYFNKQKPVASVKITAEFNFTSQPGNFCTFYDDQGQNWAVLFDSKDLTKFLDEVNSVKVKLGATKEKVAETSITKEAVTQEPPVVAKKPQTPSDNDNTKTKLMSRIAKMGQPILPLSGAIVAENSDSDEVVQTSPEPNVEIVKGRKTRPVPSSKPIPSETLYSHSTMIVPSQMGHVPPYPMMPYLPTPMNMAAPSSSGHFETLMSESRTHNSEIRMHLCRITDKIDAVLTKQNTVPEVQARIQTTSADVHPQLLSALQVLQREASSHSEKIDRILEWMNKTPVPQVNPAPPTPQPRTKSEPIQDSRITQLEEQSRRLQCEKEETERQIGQLTDRNNALTSLIADHEAKEARLKVQLTQSERDVDGMRDRLKESQNRWTAADERIRNLESQLKQKEEQNDELSSQITQFQQVGAFQNLSAEASQKIQLLESQVFQLGLQLKEKSEQHSQLLAQIQQLKEDEDRSLEIEQKLGQLESSLKEYAMKNSQLSLQNEHLLEESNKWRTAADSLQSRLDEQLSKEATDGQNASQAEQVKKIMNKVYKEIIRQFDPHESYTFPDIKSAVSEIIREVTLSMLDNQPAESRLTEPVTENKEPEQNKQEESIKSSSHPESVSEEACEDSRVPDVQPSEDTTSKVEERPDNMTADNQISVVSDGNEGRESSETAASSVTDPEVKERSLSFLESLHSSLAAARSPNTEPVWKPDPPPPPLFDDFNNDDDDDWFS